MKEKNLLSQLNYQATCEVHSVKFIFQLLGVNVTLYLARNRKSGNKPFVKKVIVWSTRGFNMDLNGAGPATAALGLAFNMLAKVSCW